MSFPTDQDYIDEAYAEIETLRQQLAESQAEVITLRQQKDALWFAAAESQAREKKLLAVLKKMEFAFTPLAKDCTLANLIDDANTAIASVKDSA